jgi:putative tricarboxylic transport membrane protein
VWEDIYAGILTNLTPAHLLTLMAGTAAGTFIGALPGLSSISAVALVLPFTFAMDPAQGLVLLAAVFMSAEFGGSIPAILLGTPGTSGASVTMLDGYPMTKKGEAQEALYLQLFAGVIGGTLGALVLLFFTPVLARWSLLLGPPEYFWLAVAGLTLVATLIGRNILGGLIGVVLGVFLTTPGQDQMTGQLRFTFGSPDMVGGLPLVPVLLGLFAVASVLTMLEARQEHVAPLTPRRGVIRYVLRRMMGMKKVLGWTSVVGTLVGIVPGIGSSASAFAAYAEAKRLSKNKDEFGKGAWEGVAAPEAANNAVVGGSLVTLLGLGIPGSTPAAIMYGALTIHGLLAGPRLFVQRADVAYTFMTGVLFTVVAMLLFGLVTVRFSSMVVRVPIRFVLPSVLALTVIGTFGLRNNIFDVVVVAFVGAAGFTLEKIGVKWVPVALGLVLGSLIESSFQQSLLIAPTRGGNLFVYWTSRPLTVALMVLVVVMLLSGVRQVARSGAPVTVAAGQGKGAASEPAGDAAAAERGPAAGKPAADTEDDAPVDDTGRWVNLRTANLVLGTGLLGMSVYVVTEIGRWNVRARYLPTLLVVLLVILAIGLLIVNLVPSTGRRRAAAYPFAGVPGKRWIACVAGLIVVAFVADDIGFYESLLVYVFGVAFMLSKARMSLRSSLVQSAAFALGLTVFLYVTFDIVLSVPTPRGLLL